MSWFRRTKAGIQTDRSDQNAIPDGYWVKCPSCGAISNRRELSENGWVCPYCDHHYPLFSTGYFDLLFDNANYELLDTDIQATDPLEFVDRKPYGKRLTDAVSKTGLQDAAQAAMGDIEGIRTSVAAMDFRFIGGSMNSVVGEILTRAIRRGYEQKVPVMIISQSGGARMMEGAYSLMQMAKTSAHLAKLSEAGLPYISLMTNPTTGGVTASFAMLGDINLAEPKALIGFAGPRVIRETIGRDLPEGFQRSEFLLERGFIDRIVHRHELKQTVGTLLSLFQEPQDA
ncbi:MAG: acetyl-CoA carboxylase, carboxyltransferase subunit beta [Bacteroidota bacterium]